MLAGLQKLQVGDATAICGKIVCGTSLFMFLPAGRDVVCPGGEIMPDDDKLLGKMFTDRTKEGYTFMWNQAPPEPSALAIHPAAHAHPPHLGRSAFSVGHQLDHARADEDPRRLDRQVRPSLSHRHPSRDRLGGPHSPALLCRGRRGGGPGGSAEAHAHHIPPCT